MTAVERAALWAMLAPDFPGVAELREQVMWARVVGCCGCGCPTIDLAVDESAPVADVPGGTPVWAEVTDAVGGDMILFVEDGRLSCVECYALDDEVRVEFPRPEAIEAALESAYWVE